MRSERHALIPLMPCQQACQHGLQDMRSACTPAGSSCKVLATPCFSQHPTRRYVLPWSVDAPNAIKAVRGGRRKLPAPAAIAQAPIKAPCTASYFGELRHRALRSSIHASSSAPVPGLREPTLMLSDMPLSLRRHLR